MASLNPFALLDSDDENRASDSKRTNASKGKAAKPAEKAEAPKAQETTQRANNAAPARQKKERKEGERKEGDRPRTTGDRPARPAGERKEGERKDGEARPRRHNRDDRGGRGRDAQRHGGKDKQSGTGVRPGPHKGGAGAGGHVGTLDEQLQGETEPIETPDVAAAAPEGGEAAAPAEGGEAAQTTEPVPEEPVDTRLTYAEFEKKRQEELANNELFGQKQERAVDVAEYEGFAVLSKSEEDDTVGGRAGKKKATQRSTKSVKLSADEIAFRHPPVERGGGGRGGRGDDATPRKGGRGGGRGGRGPRGPRPTSEGAKVNIDSAAEFPSL